MTYPDVIPELQTIHALQQGFSIARFGDGEIKLIMGKDCVSQKHSPEIMTELRDILWKNTMHNFLTGIPNLCGETAKESFWAKYREKKYTSLYNPMKIYHSAFISRPDSIPAINNAAYWSEVVKLWAGKRILLLSGGRSSALRADTMPEAKQVIERIGPQTDAYANIDHLQETVEHLAKGVDSVILCLGATATCLAWRLCVKDIHAMDLGHIGMYYRRFQRGEPANGTA